VKVFLFAATIGCCCLTGCLGYHVGPAKPYYLRDVHSIAVPIFKNHTLRPRVEAIVTDTVIKQFQQDGTFQIAGGDNGDATLKGEIEQISRTPARSVRGNVLATTEFILTMRIQYSLVARDGTVLISRAQVIGRTNFFVSPDIVTDERQALPLAAEDLSKQLVTQLSEGW
jgi:hypothetical protein